MAGTAPVGGSVQCGSGGTSPVGSSLTAAGAAAIVERTRGARRVGLASGITVEVVVGRVRLVVEHEPGLVEHELRLVVGFVVLVVVGAETGPRLLGAEDPDALGRRWRGRSSS